jgi:hypothetical protein
MKNFHCTNYKIRETSDDEGRVDSGSTVARQNKRTGNKDDESASTGEKKGDTLKIQHNALLSEQGDGFK